MESLLLTGKWFIFNLFFLTGVLSNENQHLIAEGKPLRETLPKLNSIIGKPTLGSSISFSPGQLQGPGERILMTVEAAQQGNFSGDASHKFEITSFQLEVNSPRDAASGLPTGQRMYKPIRIIKAIGNASLQFFQALVTNENLKKVTIEVHKTNPAAGASYKITLTNCNIASFIQQLTTPQNESMDNISITFQKIELSYGETGASDLWLAPQ